MKIFNWLNSVFLSLRDGIYNENKNMQKFFDDTYTKINPTSSLPIVGSVDIHGSPLGTGHSISHDPFVDYHHHENYFPNSINSANDYYNHYYDPFRSY